LNQGHTSFPRLGETFQGRYRLDEVIGQGGYARVYRAHQVDLGRDVAIKILRTHYPNAEKAEEAARRFEREAKLVSQLRDPHTLTVFDYGRTENDGLYMVSEYVDGTNLLDFVCDRGALSPNRATAMCLQLLFSLQEAHERNVLHRDIKPANVMVFDLPGRPHQVKLLDFGIAKAFETSADGADSMSVALTGKGRVVGSPGYMSPEQIRGESLAPRSDIYSLGLVLYEMVTGERAIKTNDLRAAFRQIDENPILLPDDVELPDGLREIVHRMILKAPEERFQTADEVIEAITPFADPLFPSAASQEIAVREPPPEPAVVPDVAREVDTGPEPEPLADDPSRRYLALAIAAIIVAIIATGAFLYTNL
jgi:serine/threonine protein kinase